jgi:hypothetical protein
MVTGMLPIRVLAVWLAVSGCSQSLFDAHDGEGTGPDASVLTTCPSSCIADAAAAFDGTADGADPFLVALEPTTGQGGTAALQLFVSDVGRAFSRPASSASMARA